MNYIETKELFLARWKEGYFYDSSVITYRRKLDVFFEFLTNRCGVSDNNYVEVLRGISSDKIIKSIKYYVNEYNIKFKITVDNYFTAIKCYFDFISKELKISNNNFDSTLNYENLKKDVNGLINSLDLNETDLKYPIADKTFRELVCYCDAKMNEFSVSDIVANQEREPDKYNSLLVRFTSAIMTKIVMLTGIKNKVISTISIKDYDKELNKLKINNFWIHIPDNLGMQMKKYIYIRDRLTKNNPNEKRLFVDKRGEGHTNKYSDMFIVISDVIGNKVVESVAKYTIVELIKRDTSINVIRELTSFGETTIKHCMELVNDGKKKKDFNSQNRYLDSKIRSLEIFDLL